jgi:3D (Asp-Asp-Asp) domain-containing protein
MLPALLAGALLAGACARREPPQAHAGEQPTGPMPFVATAHALKGLTKSETPVRVGTVAADTRVLPLGTRIRVTGAGRYSGVYVVTDTGRNVRGRHIDLYMTSTAEARRFGRKSVQVRVLDWGEGGTAKAAAR